MMRVISVILFQSGLFTVIHKHYSVDAWKTFAKENKGILKVSVKISWKVYVNV